MTVAQVDDDAFLLDVRDPDEWEAGHAPEAVHVPMMELPARMDEVPDDRDVVVVCRVGSRSAQVVAYLQAQGLAPGGQPRRRACSPGRRPGARWYTTDGRPGYVL